MKKGVVGTCGAKLDTAMIRAHDKDEGVDLKFLRGRAGVKVGTSTGMIKAGVSLVEGEMAGIKSKIGLNVDTGISIDDKGIEVKEGGFGFKLGKEIGLSTPLSEISINLSKLFG